MVLKFKTNFIFPLIHIVTSVSWSINSFFTDFNSFNFKCVKKTTHPIYFLIVKLKFSGKICDDSFHLLWGESYESWV